jgi:hypothetical protein
MPPLLRSRTIWPATRIVSTRSRSDHSQAPRDGPQGPAARGWDDGLLGLYARLSALATQRFTAPLQPAICRAPAAIARSAGETKTQAGRLARDNANGGTQSV